MTLTNSENEVRFVVLTHDRPTLHWDLLIEAGDSCRTWRLLSCPDELPVACESIADHRLHYLTYEGPVSGDRGTVTQWTSGVAVWITPDRVRLASDRLSGVFTLTDKTFSRV